MDMRQAKAAADGLEQEEHNVHLMLALETAIVVSYVRAFTKSTLVRLDADEYRPTWPEQPYYHDELLKLRDSRYAHTDADSGRDAEFRQVESESGDAVMAWYMEWQAFPREWLAALRGLFDCQEARFTGEVLEIKKQLDDEHPDGF
jgi:hypothetical protein